MEKVILTKEQAEAIGQWVNKGQLIVAKAAGLLEHGKDEPIDKLTMEEIVKAIYIGYEVEPEFKVGDWVKANWRLEKPTIHKLKGIDRNTVEIDGEQNNTNPGISIISLATPEEIAEEKERRWWKGHGRDVWELREDDILDYLGDLLIVDSFDSEEVYFKSNKHDSSPNKYSETPSYVQKNFKVVALSESRLDVKK